MSKQSDHADDGRPSTQPQVQSSARTIGSQSSHNHVHNNTTDTEADTGTPPVTRSTPVVVISGAEIEAIAEGTATAGEGTQDGQTGTQDGEEDDDEDFDEGSKRRTSTVWEHFKTKLIDGSRRAICLQCTKSLGAGKRAGTTHLRSHINTCVKRKVKIGPLQMILNRQQKVDGTPTLTAFNFDQAAARKEFAKMIVMHELPLSFTEYEYFRSFMACVQPLYRALCRNTVKSDILEMYVIERKHSMKLLEKNTSRIAFTTDMWTAGNQNKGYMVITSHFIDDSWTLQNRFVRFIQVPCPHTAEVLSSIMVKTFLDWNVDRKLSTITVDNCSTNDSMVNKMLERLNPSNMLLGGSLFHMRCAAHILNLIVKQGLSEIEDSIEKIRTSVAFWTASPKRVQKFEEAARQLQINFPRKLVLDCKTRWNSTYLMLSIAVEYKEAFSRLKQKKALYRHLPSEEDWEFAREIRDKFQVFHSVTELFSRTSYPTASLYFAYVCKIKIALKEWLYDPKETIRSMAGSMLSKFSSYWEKIHELMAVSSILDPRFKMMLIEFYFPKIYAVQDVDREIAKVRKYCADLVQQYSSKLNRDKMKTSSTATSVPTGALDRDDTFTDFDNFVANKKMKLTDQAKSELESYLNADVHPRSSEFDLLGWWRIEGVKYETLQMIARDLLAIPVSTVASESAFSTGGMWVSKHRSSLTAETLEALMCTQDWIWMNTQKAASMKLRKLKAIDDVEEEDDSAVTEVTMVGSDGE